jgi:hypothetical protein
MMSLTCSNCQTQLLEHAKFCSECGTQVTVSEEKPAPRFCNFKLHPWTTLLVAVILGFVILVVAGYAFNWSWTGFREYKLWDWLTILVLPSVLTSLSIGYAIDQILAGNKKKQWRRLWMILITIALVGFIVSIIGGYAFHWSWTGFSDNKFSQWVQLLIIPVAQLLVALWFTSHPIKLGKSGALTW